MKEDDDFFVSWTDRSGHKVEYRWSRLSADNKRRAWDSLDARGRETGRELIGRKLRGRLWLRANDDSGRAARDRSAVEAADKRAQEERLRAEKAKENERLRAELKPRLLEEIRTEWAEEKQRLEDELRARSSEVDRLRAESKRAADEFADLARLRSWVGRGEELAKQILDQRGEVDALEAEKKRILSEIQRLKWDTEEAKTKLSSELEAARKQHAREIDSYDRARQVLALRRADRFLWDATPAEIREHFSYIEDLDERAEFTVATLYHRGERETEIARELHIPSARISAVLQGDGVEDSALESVRRLMGPTPDGYFGEAKSRLDGPELVAKVWELHDGGKSQRDIAKLTGARLAAVNEVLKTPRPVAATNSPTTGPSAAAPSEP